MAAAKTDRPRGPRFVLLPGLDGTGVGFEPLVDAMRGRAGCTVVDYPRGEPLAYEELVGLAAEAVPRRGRFVLVGESFSGPIALALAARRPRGLAGVVLAGSFVRDPVGRLARLLAPLIRPWLFRRMPPAWLLRHFLLGHDAKAAQVEVFAQVLCSLSAEVVAHRIRTVLAVDATAELLSCPVPVLYLAARHDRLVSPRMGERLRRLRPDLELVSLPGPHLLLQRHPEPAAAALLEFAARLRDVP